MPSLLPNDARDQALAALPEHADVRVFTETHPLHQVVTWLRAGTAAKGRVDFGDQCGSSRLPCGECLVVLATLGAEAVICHRLHAPPQDELLVLTRCTLPLTDFTRL